MKISTALINRKSIITLGLALAIGTAAMSQVSIGIHATGNLSSAKINKEDLPTEVKTTARLLPGAGILVDYSVSENFSIQSGANYRKNGVTVKFDLPVEGAVLNVKMTSDLHYIQVPLNFVYKTGSEPVQFFAGAGPYIGFGISGKNKIKGTVEGGTVIMEEEVDAFKKEEDGGAGMKKIDFGAQALAGIKFGKYYATVSYQAGFTNLTKAEDSNEKYNNRGAQLTLGYIIR
jgi:outer membrane protein with beta-barrel domain